MSNITHSPIKEPFMSSTYRPSSSHRPSRSKIGRSPAVAQTNSRPKKLCHRFDLHSNLTSSSTCLRVQVERKVASMEAPRKS